MLAQVPEPVRSTMHALTEGLLTILGDRLLGVYLGGSLPMGDFCEGSSDLDFLVVTRGHLSLEGALAVGLLHRELLRRFSYAARLEGDYAPLETLVAEGTTEPVPGCERGIFLPKVGELMLSADNIANIRACGITFFGPEPGALLPEVTPEQVRAAVREMLHEGPAPCETAQEAATEVLNLVRSACALEQGAPVTKRDGAQWGCDHLGAEWRDVIRTALAVRYGQVREGDAERLSEALPRLDQLIRETYA
ncbi:MAG TPA: aminoglycoside adenylyltransferase domain-containing protein [Symbiobacteriaceae bacterium]|nr:aminoglycoside adenylyltransferase domain-containing protein [Symbiobacteriaceae bacterium]